jgi:transcriptional regulator GlxA family with amidase domain
MKVAVVTFDGYNEIDSFIAAHIINRVSLPGWSAEITAPGDVVTSMNGVVVKAQKPLEFASEADAVIVGSGRKSRDVVKDKAMMARLKLDPGRQLIASQCSGVLVLMKLGLVAGSPVCTDRATQEWVEEAGCRVLDEPFHAKGKVATAGGCLAAHYLATWMIWMKAGRQTAIDALTYALPHGEEDDYLRRAIRRVERFVEIEAASKRS